MKRVLITNNALSTRGGTEMYVRDVAWQLLQQGWQPMAFSTHLGEVAEELRAMTIPVVNDLAKLPHPPDVIHAHHHLDAMIAIQYFPGVPIIYFCHGWGPWEETPILHPQIERYVAVDELCRERLTIEHGIPESQVELLLNFVDMERFAARPPLPTRPHRALVFGNYLGPGDRVFEAIRAACERSGIALETAGYNTTASARPEALLSGFDLVFAKGRCALEAMAVGCAVVVCNTSGLGGIVTPETFDVFRPLNFGYRVLRRNPAPSTEDFLREIGSYNPASCATVSRRVRAEADKNVAVQRLIGMYEKATERSSANGRIAPLSAAQKATVDYLLFLARETKPLRQALWAAQEISGQASARMNQLEASLAEERGVVNRLRAELAGATVLQEKLDGLGRELEASRATAHQLEDALVRQRREMAALREAEGSLRRSAESACATLHEMEQRLHRFRGLKRFLPGWLARKL